MPLGSTRNNKGAKNPFFGKHHTTATKEILRQQRLGIPHFSEEEKLRRSIAYSGTGNPFYGKHHSPETVAIIKERTPRLTGFNSPNFGRVNSDYTRQRSREANTGSKNPNWHGMADNHRAKILRNLSRLPSKPERQVMAIIARNNLPFKYVGKGEVFIARKCPDFINCNGAKQIIEVAGRYWHTEEETQKRARLFAKYGFSTLIIWDDELEDEPSVELKLLKFTRKEVS